MTKSDIKKLMYQHGTTFPDGLAFYNDDLEGFIDALHVQLQGKNKVYGSQVEELYSLYPTKCPKRKATTGKGFKDKAKLERLIKQFGFDYVKASITEYVQDCVKHESYIKGFATLLNNLPEPQKEIATDNTKYNCINKVTGEVAVLLKSEVTSTYKVISKC